MINRTTTTCCRPSPRMRWTSTRRCSPNWPTWTCWAPCVGCGPTKADYDAWPALVRQTVVRELTSIVPKTDAVAAVWGDMQAQVHVVTAAERVRAEHAKRDTLLVRAWTCTRVAREAERQDVPVRLAVWLSFHESRFNPHAVSRTGHRGALQASARYWCPERTYKGCDLIAAGVSALAYNLARRKSWRAAVAHYNAGNRPGPRAWRYADKVTGDVL